MPLAPACVVSSAPLLKGFPVILKLEGVNGLKGAVYGCHKVYFIKKEGRWQLNERLMG
jgi:hypothetical protein